MQPWKSVSCQRIFPSGPGSHFIPVRDSGMDQLEQAVLHSPLQSLYERHDLIMEQQRDQISFSYEYDSDRWLKRTGWREFLSGSSRSQAIAYIIKPRQGSPSYEGKIWEAVASLLTRAEGLVQRSSHFVRVAIVQVEESHHIQQPLQPYQDRRQLQKGIQAWQQIVIFFVRYLSSGLSLTITLSQRSRNRPFVT
jgi:hypothetical protein